MQYRPLFQELERFDGPENPTLQETDQNLFRSLLLNNTPLLDVRAPVEYARGAFPGAVNLPLLEDIERQRIGTCYKQEGQDAAIALGHRLVQGDIRQARIERWQAWLLAHPDAWLYCFRGGLRSTIVQQWLAQAGTACPRVPGGYKAMRQFLVETIEHASQSRPLLVIAGATGCAKTHLLRRLPDGVDLEGHARHRGSAFGALLGGQPSQIDFENALAVDLLRLDQRQSGGRLVLEDESHAIGSLSVPFALYSAMKLAPIALIEEPLDVRADTILNDYIRSNLADFERVDPQHAFSHFAHYLLGSLDRITRRLGGERHVELRRLMEDALAVQERTGATEEHRRWITRLLQEYYDPMYRHQLARRLDRVVFRGSGAQFLAWADSTQARATA
jgi:tRNA 2-selenouridine synthase